MFEKDGKKYLTETELFSNLGYKVVGSYSGDTLILEQSQDELHIGTPEMDLGDTEWEDCPEDPDSFEGARLCPEDTGVELEDLYLSVEWNDKTGLLTLDSHGEELELTIDGVKELAYWLMQTAKRKANLQQEQKSDTDEGLPF